MNLRKFEHVLETIEKLKDLSSEIPVVVEGRRDKSALRRLGLKGEILKVQTSSSVFEFCESVAAKHSEVILFTDLDSAGRKIGKTVKKYLTDKGVKVNDTIAKKLMYALDTAEAENLAKRFERVCIAINSP